MDRLKTMQNKVEWVLTNYPQARDNDNLLINIIYTRFYGVNVSCRSFKDVTLYTKLPAYETIRRCRQKAQADHEELRGKRDKERLERQKEYIEFATETK